MRSYQSNETVGQHQLPSIEEQSTERDSLATDMLATNSQMSGQGIQTDVTFLQNPQVIVSDAKSLDDINLIIKTTPIPGPKEEKSKFIPICN